MSAVIQLAAAALAALSAVAGLAGAWAWWQVRPSQAFWVMARTAQAAAVVLAALAGVAAAAGHRPDDGIFWVYALVPAAVGLVAEQLRIASAETVLEARGVATARAVGDLPDADQRSIALAVVRREIGVMTVALLVSAFLALRALGTISGL